MKKAQLTDLLIATNTDYSDYTLYQHLFYYGEKSRFYYSQCHSPESEYKLQNTQLFSLIAKEMRKNNKVIVQFKKNNPDFSNYFLAKENELLFNQILTDKPHLSWYYRAFLHTLGKRKQFSSSFLSTSLSFEVAKEFASSSLNNEAIEPLILICSIPKLSERNTIAISFFQDLSNAFDSTTVELHQDNLPVVSADSVYEKQYEYVLNNGLFPHLILGVVELNAKRVIMNHHLFEKHNSLFNLWLNIDQSDFENRLHTETNYTHGFSLTGMDWGFII